MEKILFRISCQIILHFHFSDTQLAVCINKKCQQNQGNQGSTKTEDSASSYAEVVFFKMLHILFTIYEFLMQ